MCPRTPSRLAEIRVRTVGANLSLGLNSTFSCFFSALAHIDTRIPKGNLKYIFKIYFNSGILPYRYVLVISHPGGIDSIFQMPEICTLKRKSSSRSNCVFISCRYEAEKVTLRFMFRKRLAKRRCKYIISEDWPCSDRKDAGLGSRTSHKVTAISGSEDTSMFDALVC